MRYIGFRWCQKNAQEKSNDLIRVILGSMERYPNIEDLADIAECFVDLLAERQGVNPHNIVEKLFDRYGYIMMGNQTPPPEEPETSDGLKELYEELERHGIEVINKLPEAPEAKEPPLASGIKATEKYKKKDEKTVKEVCKLLSDGKNYSEIARELHIDRRTVKGIAVNNGFTND